MGKGGSSSSSTTCTSTVLIVDPSAPRPADKIDIQTLSGQPTKTHVEASRPNFWKKNEADAYHIAEAGR